MPLSGLDSTAIARSLSQIAERHDDHAEAYFERLDEVEYPAADEEPGVRLRREEGFAIRLSRQGTTWLAARDRIAPALFNEALRQVARALPSAPYPEPTMDLAPFPDPGDTTDLARFPGAVTNAIRRHLAAFPLRLSVRRHRRWLQVIGCQLAPEPQAECFYSCDAELPWSRYGALLCQLGEPEIEKVATSLTLLFRAREAPAAAPGPRPVVLGPAACAVLLHEVVAHALETDTLVQGGRVEAALGVRLGAAQVNVLDDPANAPEGVRRTSDDEGMITVRRWLLRDGVVEQPLADMFSAHGSGSLIAGAARRGNRHLPPAPRSTHLELLSGDASLEELLASTEGGLYLPEASRGSLDPLSGRFAIELPFGWEVRSGRVAELVGPCRIKGRVADLLAEVTGIGSETESAGAGWCAKHGQKLPVWATAPALGLAGVEVEV